MLCHSPRGVADEALPDIVRDNLDEQTVRTRSHPDKMIFPLIAGSPPPVASLKVSVVAATTVSTRKSSGS